MLCLRRWLSGVSVYLLLMSASALWAAEDQNLLAYPVQDARDTFGAGQYEFVGIQLADGVELPGLKDTEADKVRREYRIRPLNKRWETFANVEDDPAKLARLRQYALRFNLTMWRLLQKKELQDATRYRY